MIKQGVFFTIVVLLFSICEKAFSQPGSTLEPLRYVGSSIVDPTVHDAKLRLAVGVETRQVLRANRTHPECSDSFGWTYNHAPNLAYWNHRFYIQYLSNPVDEHVAPSHTLLVSSTDGKNWGFPQVVFPVYTAPEGVTIPKGYFGYMMHQRMGFYVSKDDRLLICGFYGHTEHPFKYGGIGRVVRELYKDGSFGPVYFIRYSSYNSWNETNTSFPFFTSASDSGFVNACKSLLADKLMTLQWIDEDSGNDSFYPSLSTYKDSVEATSYFHRKDGKVVALWKFSKVALSADEGITFSQPVKVPTLIMPGGKNWGQRTRDDRYAMCYNPVATQEYRYPLVVVTGDDGIFYDDMLVVHGEVPLRRYYGRWKDFGPSYVRGIVEGNGTPPGKDMWVTYSVNKEDIWVSRIPLPIKYASIGQVNDNFDALCINGSIPEWNIYSPQWASVKIVTFPGTSNNCLELSDSDPYDYAKAVKVFQEGNNVSVKFKVFPKQNSSGDFCIDLLDRYGNRPVRLNFRNNGMLTSNNGDKDVLLQSYQPDKWVEISIEVNTNGGGSFDISVDGLSVLKGASLAARIKSIERISFCTGNYRNIPDRQTPNQKVIPPLVGADEHCLNAAFLIDDLHVISNMNAK